MDKWVRFEHAGKPGFGKLQGDIITVYQGDMFNSPSPTTQTAAPSAVKLLTPTQPTKMIAIWNNFHALAAKLNQAIPKEPLYLIKTSNSFLASGEVIRWPASFDGKVVFEGELGVVIGKTCKAVSEAEAPSCIFGYTCINDVTAADIINRDPAFQQWVRAKSFDTFGVFGPVAATGLDPLKLSVKTVLNGQERQNYPVSDMIFPPAKLVSLISQDMTLYPGDVICCGTSVGVGSMKPGSQIEVTIEGIGTLANRFD
ncbi:MAG: 2-hydroxyhepta-2,4-diene-1,7-dioate isomerase [Betaproteobacteria bacterium RIFCSPLOWO2_12_FULL_62_13]|nr:MAG: 2-hydroxyhepta-2,4-diene-1,7-dioate isomerase [Betaproteobacteria bacterium RIFCSPLOWO2_12_FULL_62_13]